MSVKWIQLPAEPLYWQPDQTKFLDARRRRYCGKCNIEYQKVDPLVDCPKCGSKGIRVFDRLTIIAGRRFGKSLIGSIAGVEEASIPNSVGWACAPTNPKLHRYVIPAFQRLIPPDWVEDWNKEFLDLRLKNGSLIHFQTLEDPDQGRGQGLDWLWIDEVCELTKTHWDVIRPSLAGNTVAFFTTTPRGYDWVRKDLYIPAEQGTPGYWACKALTSSSANPRINADFLAREREQMSDEMYRQEYEADFVTFQGAVYGDLIPPQILRTDDEIRLVIPEWRSSIKDIHDWRACTVGIDTGADHPFGGVKIISTEFGLVVVGDYLERHKSFSDHAAALKRLAHPNPVRWAINKNERQQMIELAQHGIHCNPANNDQMSGNERVKTWLRNKQLWFIERLCPRTIAQMQSYQYDKNISPKDEQKRQERVFKKDDELPDCIRYALMTWPQLPKVEDKPTERDLSKLPAEIAHSLARLRRLEKEPEPTFETNSEDFWR